MSMSKTLKKKKNKDCKKKSKKIIRKKKIIGRGFIPSFIKNRFKKKQKPVGINTVGMLNNEKQKPVEINTVEMRNNEKQKPVEIKPVEMLNNENPLIKYVKGWIGLQNTAYWKKGKKYKFLDKYNTFENSNLILHQIDKLTVFKIFQLFSLENGDSNGGVEQYIRIYRRLELDTIGSNEFYLLFESGSIIEDLEDDENHQLIVKTGVELVKIMLKEDPKAKIILCGHSYGSVCALDVFIDFYASMSTIENLSVQNLFVVGSAPFKWINVEKYDYLESHPELVKNIIIYGLNITLFSNDVKDKECELYSEMCSGLDNFMLRPRNNKSLYPKHYSKIMNIFKIRKKCKNEDINNSHNSDPNIDNFEIQIQGLDDININNMDHFVRNSYIEKLCKGLTHDWKVYRKFFEKLLFK